MSYERKKRLVRKRLAMPLEIGYKTVLQGKSELLRNLRYVDSEAVDWGMVFIYDFELEARYPSVNVPLIWDAPISIQNSVMPYDICLSHISLVYIWSELDNDLWYIGYRENKREYLTPALQTEDEPETDRD